MPRLRQALRGADLVGLPQIDWHPIAAYTLIQQVPSTERSKRKLQRHLQDKRHFQDKDKSKRRCSPSREIAAKALSEKHETDLKENGQFCKYELRISAPLLNYINTSTNNPLCPAIHKAYASFLLAERASETLRSANYLKDGFSSAMKFECVLSRQILRLKSMLDASQCSEGFKYVRRWWIALCDTRAFGYMVQMRLVEAKVLERDVQRDDLMLFDEGRLYKALMRD